jgi:4-hydroxy-tetrahydrodipicolinate synthase
MSEYTKSEAREWAKASLRGCANVIIPSYSADTRNLNEAGIRHDVRREIELGFSGALLVSETAITPDEYVEFAEWSVDEAAGRLQLLHHASFNTLEENIDVARRVHDAGAVLALLSYPPTFLPQSTDDIYQYTKAFCDAVDIAVMLFPVPLWGFERIHGASLDPNMIRQLVDECPNVVAVKAEGGFPSIGGFMHCYHLVGDDVIVTMPSEEHAIPLKTSLDLQWMGTSGYEFYGDAVPRMFDLLEKDDLEGAMSIFWQLHPARQVKHQVMSVAGSNFAHRYVWKYMGWLHGFNGGPLRMPTMRIVPTQMQAMRSGVERAGLEPTTEPDSEFFVGRNPC